MPLSFLGLYITVELYPCEIGNWSGLCCSFSGSQYRKVTDVIVLSFTVVKPFNLSWLLEE